MADSNFVDELHGGDGLPDWMQFSITTAMFGLFVCPVIFCNVLWHI